MPLCSTCQYPDLRKHVDASVEPYVFAFPGGIGFIPFHTSECIFSLLLFHSVKHMAVATAAAHTKVSLKP